MCVCVGCMDLVVAGGLQTQARFSFDYSNYDLERGEDYYEHMGQ